MILAPERAIGVAAVATGVAAGVALGLIDLSIEATLLIAIIALAAISAVALITRVYLEFKRGSEARLAALASPEMRLEVEEDALEEFDVEKGWSADLQAAFRAADLSDLERQALGLRLKTAKSNQEIAAELDLTRAELTKTLYRVIQKLSMRANAPAVRTAEMWKTVTLREDLIESMAHDIDQPNDTFAGFAYYELIERIERIEANLARIQTDVVRGREQSSGSSAE